MPNRLTLAAAALILIILLASHGQHTPALANPIVYDATTKNLTIDFNQLKPERLRDPSPEADIIVDLKLRDVRRLSIVIP